MRINKKLIKKRQRANRIKLPRMVRETFAKEIAANNVPSGQQIKMAVNLGLVKKNNQGGIDPKSLANYFKVFIQQRKDDDQRHRNE